MNIIIVGCGKVGQKITEKLSLEVEHNITVVDLCGNKISDLIGKYDVMGVKGNGTSREVLVEAGVENADILIAVTGNDEINLLTCLIAKKTGNCGTIARIRKPEYNKEIHVFKEDLGLAMVINPEQAAANEIARILRFPTAIQIDTFAKGGVEILKFRVSEDSPINHMRIAEVNEKFETNILICGVERGDKAFIPGGDFVIEAGDMVSFVSSVKNGTKFFKNIGLKTSKIKDTIIVGGGTTGYYLANQLLQLGFDVKIIEQSETRCDELCQLLPKATVINGDGTDNSLLLESGVEYADSFVSLTNIDEENILLSMFARSKMKGKIVTKINRIAYDEVISGLNLDSTVYPKDITAEYIVRFVRAKSNSMGSSIETIHFILDGKAEALEFSIGKNSPVANIQIGDLDIKENTLIACIIRAGNVITPHGNDVICEDDTVIVVTSNHGYKSINDILI